MKYSRSKNVYSCAYLSIIIKNNRCTFRFIAPVIDTAKKMNDLDVETLELCLSWYKFGYCYDYDQSFQRFYGFMLGFFFSKNDVRSWNIKEVIDSIRSFSIFNHTKQNRFPFLIQFEQTSFDIFVLIFSFKLISILKEKKNIAKLGVI